MPRPLGKVQFSPRSSTRKPSAIRKLAPLANVPGMISLAGGFPNPATFPIHTFSFKFNDTDIAVPEDYLNAALQYSPSSGVPMVVKMLQERMTRIHSPPYTPDVVTGTGSMDLISKIFDMFVGPDDVLLVEEPTYAGSLSAAAITKGQVVGLPQDSDGIIPSSLSQILATHKDKVKLLYTIPTGQNPSGLTTSTERKKEIYEIASQHNIPILEDDPYYNLYYGDKQQPTSYLGMDVDQRVIRCDSFSKVLSAGMRFGWATGPPELIAQLVLDIQSSCMHSNGLSQVMVLRIFEEIGEEGFHAHLKQVQDFYKGQRDALVQAVNKHLSGMVEYTIPQAGMFLWMKLLQHQDSWDLIANKAKDELVLLVPGAEFYPPNADGSKRVANTVRASFSVATPDKLDEGMKRLAQLIRI